MSIASSIGARAGLAGIGALGGGVLGGMQGAYNPQDRFRDSRMSGAISGAARGVIGGMMMGTMAGYVPGLARGMFRGVAKNTPSVLRARAVAQAAAFKADPMAAALATSANSAAYMSALEGRLAGAGSIYGQASILGGELGEGIGKLAQYGQMGVRGIAKGARQVRSGMMRTPIATSSAYQTMMASPGHKARSAAAIALTGAGVGLGATYLGVQASAGMSDLGHPMNAVSAYAGGATINATSMANQRQAARMQGIAMRNPYAIGQRDMDSAYSFNSSLAGNPGGMSENSRTGLGITPGAYGDTGSLVLAMNALRRRSG